MVLLQLLGEGGQRQAWSQDINVSLQLWEMSHHLRELQLYVLVTRDPHMSWDLQQSEMADLSCWEQKVLIDIHGRYLSSICPEQVCLMLISCPSDKLNWYGHFPPRAALTMTAGASECLVSHFLRLSSSPASQCVNPSLTLRLWLCAVACHHV